MRFEGYGIVIVSVSFTWDIQFHINNNNNRHKALHMQWNAASHPPHV